MEDTVPSHVDQSSNADAHRKNWSAIGVKVIYPLFLAMIAGVTISGIFIDNYFLIDTSKLAISAPDSASEIPHENLIVRVMPRELEILEPEDLRGVKMSYTIEAGSIYANLFRRFDNHLVGLDFTVIAWHGVQLLGYTAVGLTGLALLLQLIFREEPTTLVFKVGSTVRESWKGALPLWLSFLAAAIGMIRVLSVTSFIQSVAARMAFYSVFMRMTATERLEFEAALDRPAPRTYLLETMRSIGTWLGEGGCKWSLSTYSVLIAATLNLMLVSVVFYRDTRIARIRLSLDSDRNPQLVAAMRREMQQLPRHCRIRSIGFSMLSFTLAVIASKVSGRYSWNIGRSLNRLRWTKGSDEFGGVNDIISSYTRHIWLHPPEIVDGAVVMWVPLALVIILGSINRLDAFSKLVEVISYGYWFRVPAIAMTIFPTPTTPVQLPICYGEWMMNYWSMLSTSEFCNDMIYSGHATLALTPSFIVVFVVIYGPFRDKWSAIVSLMTGVFTTLLVIVIGRFHYTADVLVSAAVCFFLALIHAPAWKLLFSYRRFQLNLGSLKGLEQCTGQLELVCSSVDVLTKSNKIDYELTNWTIIEQKKEIIRNSLEKLKSGDMHTKLA